MNVALVLSGGTGTRLGADIPKQYIEVNGKMVIAYCIEQLSLHPMIDAIQIVASEQWQDAIKQCLLLADPNKKFRGFSEPGENRQLSIYHGLEDIKKYVEHEENVLIHDAARPMLSHQLITDCMHALEEHDGVLPVLPMKDTVYSSVDGKSVSSLLDRKEIYAGQAPEAFKIDKYYEANQRLMPEQILHINGSTEPAVMAGMDIAMIPGDENNFKITTKTDMEKFCRMVEMNYKQRYKRKGNVIG